MPVDNWDRVQEIFLAAADLPAAEQSGFLDTACLGDAGLREEVESLLRADSAGEAPLVAAIEAEAGSLLDEEPIVGLRLGAYRVIRQIGRGGMGAVYLAERDDDQYRKQVAIKVVKRGMDTAELLGRFRHERQILASLEHPYIARLLDGGATPDGRPFFVMEYVEGQPIDAYCRDRHLDVEARLRLFLRVCEAVSFAHHNLVVHRDLKPGNILVTAEGAPKLLDFGVAKLLTPGLDSRLTATGLPMGPLTPDYASPEQVRGDPITVAADIYALGTVLYELLTGNLAQKITTRTPVAIEKVVCETQVLRPSAVAGTPVLRRRLAGDLDNILQHALEKAPERRYASVEQFSDDLLRHLSHQPIKARPDTSFYRLAKFVRRRRGAVAAGAAVVASLLMGLIVSRREAHIANENLAQVRRLANVFVFEVHDAVRELPGSTRARQLIVETGLRYLDGLAVHSRRLNGELQSELAAAYQRIGEVQGDVMSANLGNTKAALDSYRKALALLDSVVEHEPGNRKAQFDRITLYQRIATIHSYTADSRQALANLHEAERLGEALLARNPGDEQIRRLLADIYRSSSSTLRRSGEYAAAFDESSKALALLLESSGGHPDDRALQQLVAEAYTGVGMSEARLGRLKDALDHHRRAVLLAEQLARLDPANLSYQRSLALAYSNVGDVLGNPNLPNLGDTTGALDAYKRIVDIGRRLYEADPADQRAVLEYGIALGRVAGALPEERAAERISLLQESQQLFENVARVNPQNLTNRDQLAQGYRMLGDALWASGEISGAVRSYREGLRLAETLLEAGQSAPPLTVVAACRRLAEEAARRGDRKTSLAYGQRALEISDPQGPFAKGRPAAVQRILTARGPTAMGLVYASLARVDKANTEQAREDRRQSEIWLEKGLVAWRQFQSDPAFAPVYRKEIQQVEAALTDLQKR